MPKPNIDKFLELINLYPSPHNGQPVRIKPVGSKTFELYFQKERGLRAADISYIFSFVSMGVFVEHMRLSAAALGHTVKITLTLPKEGTLHGDGIVRFAKCTVQWNAVTADKTLEKTLRQRQTSRKKYHEGVNQASAQKIIDIAKQHKMKLTQLPKAQAQQAIWLNQRAVFDDMFDEPVRRELNYWLRYNQTEKQTAKDGLSYDCMELNGKLIKFIVAHPGILRAPGLSWIIRQYYLRTMRDASDVFYMMAPFDSGKDAFTIGETIMKIWRMATDEGYYLHPFGTIMSNHAAHQDFLKLTNETDESRAHSYLVFIFRCGKSATPVRSLRIPYKEHLLLEQQNV